MLIEGVPEKKSRNRPGYGISMTTTWSRALSFAFPPLHPGIQLGAPDKKIIRLLALRNFHSRILSGRTGPDETADARRWTQIRTGTGRGKGRGQKQGEVEQDNRHPPVISSGGVLRRSREIPLKVTSASMSVFRHFDRSGEIPLKKHPPPLPSTSTSTYPNLSAFICVHRRLNSPSVPS